MPTSEGFEIIAEFVEVETGKGSDALDRRPQLAAALAKPRALRCPVAVAKLDRLSRDVHFISGLMADRGRSGIDVKRLLQTATANGGSA